MTRWWWRLCQWTIRLLGIPFWQLRGIGMGNIPREGGALLVANHQSFLDPPLVAAFLPREMHFMARRSLFKNPLFRALIVSCNAFPIERDSADVKGVRSAIERLGAGNLLLVFPEGTRTLNGEVGEMKPGVGILADRAAVPVVPVLIDGAHAAWPKGALLPRFGRIRIVFGRPFKLDARDASAGEKIRQAILDLRGES
jgi:1-acyl-sn-glycerol-3-phosphate acyltransferase